MNTMSFPFNDEACSLVDWLVPLAFNCKRHHERIKNDCTDSQKWRMKDRMKTVSVALVLCLNVGVDPPDVVKMQPCARLECWIDPGGVSGGRALEAVAVALQHQYEKWQPRARYKHCLDPTVDEVKRLCTSLRRNAKDERVLFHYNGHGVPKPTSNGEIWVFNKTYTQYIPLSVYDLQQWMGSPSIYVYDCNCAGLVLESYEQFANQHEREHEVLAAGSAAPAYSACVQLAACSATQLLPMNPELPADLFTACLTTPVTIALKWFVIQNSSKFLPEITVDMIDKIPGQVSDRRTMLGELNWVFTAVTDTIAWSALPRPLFLRLFRQDLLLASLCRNFLLADRLMRAHNCTPLSSPPLPSTAHHHMWQAWDLTVDGCLRQLPALLGDPQQPYVHSTFFSDQLTAFQVWLSLHMDSVSEPEQLPIVLQVLLSQVHRLRALELLGRFLDIGPKAVNLALSVGIFPYVLKLLQSSARELRPLLVFIWAKVLAVDSTCQGDLVRDGSFKYFLSVLAESFMPSEQRMMAAFCVSCIVYNYRPAQAAALQSGVVSVCLEQLREGGARLRQWAAICLGRTWERHEAARWCGVRDSAHEKLAELLEDPEPEVRASAVYALGTFVNSGTSDRTDHVNALDHTVGMMLVSRAAADSSPLVRMEVVVALQWFIIIFENQFLAICHQHMEEEKSIAHLQIPDVLGLRRIASRERLRALLSGSPGSGTEEGLRRVSSSGSLGYASVFGSIWRALLALAYDPFPDVACPADDLIDYVRNKVMEIHYPENYKTNDVSETVPSLERPILLLDGEPHLEHAPYQYFAQFSRIRRTFDKGPENRKCEEENEDASTLSTKGPLVSTEFISWSSKYFTQPILQYQQQQQMKDDVNSPEHVAREWLYLRNESVRSGLQEERKQLDHGKLDEQIFINKNRGVPTALRLHSFEPYMVVTDKEFCSIWDWQKGCLLHCTVMSTGLITTLDFINEHDDTLLMLGSDNGSVRILKNFTRKSEIQLITAFQIIQDLLPSTRGSGLVLHWEQHTRHLLATGDVRFVRIWDAVAEAHAQEMWTGAESCVTCLTSASDCPGLVTAGFGDGTLRLYDRRISESCVNVWHEHSGWVVDCFLHEGQIVSGSVAGDVRFWDIRSSSSIRNVKPTHGMTAMAIHPEFDVIACGSADPLISVLSKGESLSTIKYHDGFMGQRISPVSCLAFHPLKVMLAAGSTDSLISLYVMNRKY